LKPGPGVIDLLYADANGAYGVKQGIRVAEAATGLGLRWLEEPVRVR
jgi:L-alanine-DL-glutamate epimerase-like enolase superfamily enzyme